MRPAGRPIHAVRVAVALATSVGVLFGAPSPSAAQKSLVIERFHSRVEVQPSGDMLVTETLAPRFTGQWNGVVRRIGLTHITADGGRARLDVEVLGATGETGQPLRTEVDQQGDAVEVRIWVPDAEDRTAEVELRYRVSGAVRFFEGADGGAPYDELAWQATMTDWEVPLEQASAEIVLPPGAEPLQAAAYQGPPASQRQVEVRTERGQEGIATVSAAADGTIRPGEGLSLAVGWPAGHVAVPGGVTRSPPVALAPSGSATGNDGVDFGSIGDASPVGWLPLLLPFVVFWLAYRAWDRGGRDPKERAITVRWEPPEGLNAAELGTLVDHSPDMHDIIATLVDLAVRGYLVIVEREKKGFLKFGKDYAFHLVRPRSDWDDLTEHERLFLNGLFKGSKKREVLANLAEEGTLLDSFLESVAGEPASDSAPPDVIDSVFLSDLQNEFYEELPDIKHAVLDRLVEKGFYARRPDQVRNRWGVGALLAGLLVFATIPLLSAGTPTALAAAIATAIAGLVSALVLGVFAFLMPARTEKGARTREAALGFKRFLERVESPRYRRMIQSPEQFEAYLPFAMAFQCEETWAEAFEDLLTEPPNWYHGTHGSFHATSFAGDMSRLASTASSTMASSPSSSGSGGGGSVGSASGGGGGGGGF